MRPEICHEIYEGGFTVVEMLAVLVMLSVLYAFLSANFEARRQAAAFDVSMVQARLLADAAEVERQRGTLQFGDDTALAEDLAPAPTPFGGAYRIAATEHAAVVSFDLPFEVRGGGVFVAHEDGGGTLRITPSVFAPTIPMQEKALLYQEPVR